MTEHDGEDPAQELVSTASRASRATLMAAAVAAEQVARHWRSQAEHQVNAGAADAERRQARYDSQRALARIEVSAADASWIAHSDVDQVARVWETARAWSDLEPAEFGPAADRIGGLVHDKYGVDLRDDRPRTADELRSAAQREPSVGRADRVDARDELSAAGVLATAGQDAAVDRAEDDALTHDAPSANRSAHADQLAAAADGYDTSARRDALVERAVAAGTDPQTARGRSRAANAQARPTREATSAGESRPRPAPRRAQRGVSRAWSERGQ